MNEGKKESNSCIISLYAHDYKGEKLRQIDNLRKRERERERLQGTRQIGRRTGLKDKFRDRQTREARGDRQIHLWVEQWAYKHVLMTCR